tara:strand:- start:141 stop:602 length:462 start_codon:yes stop_codon:yes gene_type:complete
MNYDIAKKLKDAGFPQREDFVVSAEDDLRSSTYGEGGFHSIYDSSCGEELEYLKKTPVKDWQGKGRATVYFKKEYLESEEGKYLTVYKPSLSELIEACGGSFNHLSYVREEGEMDADGNVLSWVAKAIHDFGECQGSTPEESVANLYLKLHEK